MSALEPHLLHQLDHSASFFWHRVRFGLVASLLPRGRAVRVLDVGAGAGFLGDFLRRERPDAEYLFVEPLEALERELERRFGAAANARGRERYEAEYVTLMDVLEHQEDDEGFLRDLVGRMDAGATLVVTVPALPALWSGWDVALGHFRRYDKGGLRRVLVAAGAEVRETSYLFPELLPPALLRKRRRPSSAAREAEFPTLPPALNTALTGVGSATARLRRLWPAGTSLLAVAARRPGP